MFEDRWCLQEPPPPLLPQRWVLLEYSSFDQFPKEVLEDSQWPQTNDNNRESQEEC